MERTMKLLVFIGLLYSVCAQNTTTLTASLVVPASEVVSSTASSSTTTSTTSSTSSSATPVPTSTVHMVTSTHVVNPTPTPTGTPTPKPPTPEIGNYTLRNSSDMLCLKMAVTLEASTTYNKTDGGNVTVHIPIVATQDISSFCDQNLASLLLTWKVNDTDNYLNFTFHKNATSWVADKVNYRFEVTDIAFPDFPLGDGTHNFTYDTALFRSDDTNRNFKQSYLCNATRNLEYSDTNFTSTLSVKDLRVQAFEFKNYTSGVFDSAYNCNNRGNKIVPIAVGAALAGLVIVVLIAYLIGRLKRRNQGSYEALS